MSQTRQLKLYDLSLCDPYHTEFLVEEILLQIIDTFECNRDFPKMYFGKNSDQPKVYGLFFYGYRTEEQFQQMFDRFNVMCKLEHNTTVKVEEIFNRTLADWVEDIGLVLTDREEI